MKEIEVFIAGAKEQTVLRDSAVAALMRVSNKFRNIKIVFHAYSFEDFMRSFTADSEGRQGDYNRYISNKADYVICIFDKAIGEISLSELELACESLKIRQKPEVFVYCNEDNVRNDIKFDKLLSFIEDNHQYYICYKDGTFRDEVYNDFVSVCLSELYNVHCDMDVDYEDSDKARSTQYKIEVVKDLWNSLSKSTKSMFYMLKTAVESGNGFGELVELNNNLLRALRRAEKVLPADVYEKVMTFVHDVPVKGFNWVVGECRKCMNCGVQSLGSDELQRMHNTLIYDVVNVDEAQIRINEVQKMLISYCNNL